MRRSLMTAIGVVFAGAVLLTVTGRHDADAHCQVPCGIYADDARIAAMLEDTATIIRAMNEINRTSRSDKAQDVNQWVRWINTKETHASHIITTVSEYFLTQKVKDVPEADPGYAKYLASLATHHKVLRAAMKTKQTVDPANAEQLRDAILALGEIYGYEGE